MNDAVTQYVLLSELRSLNKRNSLSAPQADLDVEGIAKALNQPLETVQGVLVELISLRLVEPHRATFGRPAESGRCRITAAGIRAHSALEAKLQQLQRQSVQASSSNPVGFAPPE